jgi:hypothetical protein
VAGPCVFLLTDGSKFLKIGRVVSGKSLFCFPKSRLLVMRLLFLLFTFGFCLPHLVFAQKKGFKLGDELVEVSGLSIASPDSIWWLNDGGSRPRLYCTDHKGRIKERENLPVQNRDWEDLCADQSGYLYIGDFGNNLNRRTDLRIYRYHPGRKSLDSILFRYPDQTAFPPPLPSWNFDAEAMVWYRDSLHIFSKNRLQKGNYYCKHYIIPATPGAYVAILRDSILLPKRVATGAAISSDGQTLALVSYFFRVTFFGILPKTRTSIWLFRDFQGSNFFQGTIQQQRVGKFPVIPTQYESIGFVNEKRVMIATERTVILKQKARQVKLKTPKPKLNNNLN